MIAFLRAGIIAALLSLFALPLAAQPTKPDFSGKDPRWIKDAASQCWAANPSPEPGETIAWTGGCENGLLSGKGTLTWYLNGRAIGRDEGEFKNGQLFGHGRISFADGAVYDGEFPGFGTMTLPDGSRRPARSIQETAGWSVEEARPEDVPR